MGDEKCTGVKSNQVKSMDGQVEGRIGGDRPVRFNLSVSARINDQLTDRTGPIYVLRILLVRTSI